MKPIPQERKLEILEKLKNGIALSEFEKSYVFHLSHPPRTDEYNWKEIHKEYFSNKNVTKRELAEKHRIPLPTFYYKTRQWDKDRDQLLKEAKEEVKKEIQIDLKAWLMEEYKDMSKMKSDVNLAWDKAWIDRNIIEKETVQMMEGLSRIRTNLHEGLKSSLGIAEKVDFTSKGDSLHESLMKTHRAIRELFEQKKISSIGIDVDEMIAEPLEEG